ncbi:MAG: hypothetical protein ACO3XP_02440 [Ilumatobacteraceae bacterium]
MSYFFQVLVLVVIASTFFGPRLRHAWWYCSIWAVAVLIIRFQYGTSGEVLFYSNDQRYHSVVTNALVELGLSNDWNYMMRSGRLAYTLPAALLHWVGFDTVLGLKFVSLLCLLGTGILATRTLNESGTDDKVLFRYLLLLGPAGLFFSTLALRETSMLFLTTLFFLTQRPAIRAVVLLAVTTLRPHLAVALMVGLLLAPLAQFVARRLYYLAVAVVLFVPATLGNAGYSVGRWAIDGGDFSLDSKWLSSEALTRIFSNLIGVQFLTADSSTTELNFADLMLARIPFFETILIPILFSMTMLLAPRLSILRWQIFAAFSFYLGLVTVTDFNSFRQNVPFMTLFGLLVVTEALLPSQSLTRDEMVQRVETSS